MFVYCTDDNAFFRIVLAQFEHFFDRHLFACIEENIKTLSGFLTKRDKKEITNPISGHNGWSIENASVPIVPNRCEQIVLNNHLWPDIGNDRTHRGTEQQVAGIRNR